MEKETVSKDVSVQFFIRFSRTDGELKDRARLIAKDEKGREFCFTYDDIDGEMQDLNVCDLLDK